MVKFILWFMAILILVIMIINFSMDNDKPTTSNTVSELKKQNPKLSDEDARFLAKQTAAENTEEQINAIKQDISTRFPQASADEIYHKVLSELRNRIKQENTNLSLSQAETLAKKKLDGVKSSLNSIDTGDVSWWFYIIEAILLITIAVCFQKKWSAGWVIALVLSVIYPIMYFGIGWGVFSSQYVPTMIGLAAFTVSLYLFTRSAGAIFAGILILVAVALMFATHLQWLDPFEEAMNAAVSETPSGISSSETIGAASQEEASATGTTSSKAGVQNRSIFDKPEPIEKDYMIVALHQKLCGLPDGKHIIRAQQTQLQVVIQNDPGNNGGVETIHSIIGGKTGADANTLPYPHADYHWGILFNGEPSGSKVHVKSGCVKISFNIPLDMEKYYNLKLKPNRVRLIIE